MIAVIDYNIGNIGSVLNMLRKIGENPIATSDSIEINRAEKIILPGVGSFGKGMHHLEELGLIDILNENVLLHKKPILGICLGMQLFTKKSEESVMDGLGWLNAETKRFNFNENLKYKIPHMGWNTIKVMKPNNLFLDLENNSKYYFVHSYHVVCSDESDILSITNYGSNFVSSFCRDNIWGTQFHPEKSHKYGMKLLSNFANLSC